MLLATALLGLAACAKTTPPARVTAVSPFSLERYQGQWYEIARLDHRFERGMSDVSAFYAPQANGSVRVINRGYKAEQQRWHEAIGKAYFSAAPSTASLKVSFFGPFYGGYHVAALDPDYRWALVLGPSTDYAWILAREKSLPPDTQAQLVQAAQALGVNTDAFIWVSHSRTDPTHTKPKPSSN